jgi:glycosyltransferase involved in cell wall biosynthesis
MPIHIVGEYFRLIRRAHNPAFISRAVRNTYYERLLRGPGDGPVLRLGSDSLKLLQPPADPVSNSHLHFSVIGTIEPRKRHLQVLRAFKPLLASVPGLKLTFAGKLGWLDAADARELESATSWPGFEWIHDVSDSGIASVLSRSRASLFLSAAEGFGLPPVESLSLSVPVIASRGIPSLEDIGETGVRLVPDDPDSIRQAVLDFCDDEYHARKCAEVRTLNLPTWTSFSPDVLTWINPAAGDALRS